MANGCCCTVTDISNDSFWLFLSTFTDLKPRSCNTSGFAPSSPLQHCMKDISGGAASHGTNCLIPAFSLSPHNVNILFHLSYLFPGIDQYISSIMPLVSHSSLSLGTLVERFRERGKPHQDCLVISNIHLSSSYCI